MNNRLAELSAAEQADLIRTKQISAVELLDSVLHQTEKAELKNHAFITICEKEAREKARNVDKKIAAGEPVGKLAGVPYSAKDMFCTRAIQTTAGSAILKGWIPSYNAAAIERMDEADAVLFGKTNCDEFGMGGTNENTAYLPYPSNPHDSKRTAGGSSGGSAAAVAGFEGAISLGTDTGGSIREPAAFCGIIGLKPTYGRVSRWGTIAFTSSMDTVGPLTRTVKDCALTLQVLAGFDPRDNVTGKVPVPDYLTALEKGVKGLRVGLSPDLMKITQLNSRGEFESFPIDPEIEASLYKTAEMLESAGAEIITDVPMPNTKYSVPAYFVISRVEAYSNLQRYDGLKYGKASPDNPGEMHELFSASRGEGFGQEVKLRILTGLFISQKDYFEKYCLRAEQARALIRMDFDRIFDSSGTHKLDVLLTPTTPLPAFRFDRSGSDPIHIQYADQFTAPMNFAGLPCISFPSGTNTGGLPIGIQAVGYDYCEEKILRTAYAVEAARKAERECP